MTKAPRSDPFPKGEFDITVIGAGVVGCAVARRFAVEGARVLILEKAADILEGASKGNSAILHSGFDAPPNSLEQSCIERGYREYLEIRKKFGLPLNDCGALVLAWNEDEAEKLESLMEKARANGVTDVELLSQKAITAREPHLSSAHFGGFLVPGEAVIDPWTTPYLYLLQAIEMGACLSRATEVRGGRFDGKAWHLETSRGALSSHTVVNCAGLYGDQLEANLLGKASFAIRPRKGQFLVYDKAARRHLSSIILPVPKKSTKGMLISPTIFGNLLVGPTAEEQESREDASVEAETLRALKAEGERLLPALRGFPVTATFAGIRPASDARDYAITYRAEKHYLAVGGIRSTGLSSALGIASHVFQLYGEEGSPHLAPPSCQWPEAISIAEEGPRDWQKPDNGGIVCHCELVTRREIRQALEGPLAAASLAGLKRRTRATMGRCQGFFCSAELAELTAGRFSEPLARDLNDGG